MKNWNKIAVFGGLALLIIVLTTFLPGLDFFAGLRPLRHGFPWIIFGLFWIFFWCCCGGRRGCCRRRCHREDSAPETSL